MRRRSFWSAIALLGCIAFLLLVFAGTAAETWRQPVPRWWWIGLWRTYIACLVVGTWMGILLGPASRVQADLFLAPGALRSELTSELRSTAWAVGGVLLLPMLAWTLAIRSGAPLTFPALLWVHLQVALQGLAAMALRSAATWQWGRWGAVFVGLGLSLAMAGTFADALWTRLPESSSVRIAILSSPLLSAYSAAGEDILRSGFWYGATHLGSWRFVYPAPAWSLVLPGTIVLLVWLLLPLRCYRWDPLLSETLEVRS